MDKDSSEILARFHIHPDSPLRLPSYDVVLAQVLLPEAEPNTFFKTANRHLVVAGQRVL
ncbi:MAG: hypothetical protein JO279_00925 [Verrucomicrobia bacterium]|nr:hypothetical protein [Verrucomicrobiota bacterium]